MYFKYALLASFIYFISFYVYMNIVVPDLVKSFEMESGEKVIGVREPQWFHFFGRIFRDISLAVYLLLSIVAVIKEMNL